MRIEYNKRKVLDKIYVYDLLFKKVSGYQRVKKSILTTLDVKREFLLNSSQNRWQTTFA